MCLAVHPPPLEDHYKRKVPVVGHRLPWAGISPRRMVLLPALEDFPRVNSPSLMFVVLSCALFSFNFFFSLRWSLYAANYVVLKQAHTNI